MAEHAKKTKNEKKRLSNNLDGQREMRVEEFLKLCVALGVDPRKFVTREIVDEVASATKRSIENHGRWNVR